MTDWRIPPPMAILCWLRCWWRTVIVGAPVAGHYYRQISPTDSPLILRCDWCGKVLEESLDE